LFVGYVTYQKDGKWFLRFTLERDADLLGDEEWTKIKENMMRFATE